MFKTFMGAVALATTATAANAESISVKTHDLDLTTEAGVKELDQRIVSAARKICQPELKTGSRLRASASPECVKRTAAEARQNVAALQGRTNS